MNKANEPIEFHRFEVGQPYDPNVRSWPETSDYVYRGGEHDLVLFLHEPTEREIQAARTGQAEFGLVFEDGVIMLCHKFGDALPWSDSAFTQWLVVIAERSLPPLPEAAEHALMFVSLVDASTGILLTSRMTSLSPEFTMALHKAIRRQARTAFRGKADFEKRVARIRRRYPTTDALVAAATARCTGGSDGPEQMPNSPGESEDKRAASKSIEVVMQEHSSINDVFLGINNYISTGDHYGEGVALDAGAGNLIVVIGYDPSKPQEIADLTALKVRFEELRQTGLQLREETELRATRGEDQFDYLLLHVHQDDLTRLAQGLVREPGQAGWGSNYTLVQVIFPEVRGMILSREGT